VSTEKISHNLTYDRIFQKKGLFWGNSIDLLLDLNLLMGESQQLASLDLTKRGSAVQGTEALSETGKSGGTK
jgi:hypothetical protein